jgi:hypothetical protein
VARTPASDKASGGAVLELRRAAVMLAVVAAHVTVILVMWRGARSSAEALDITLFALPITPEERPREPAPLQEPPVSRAAETIRRSAPAARASATVPAHAEPSLGELSRSETEVPGNKVTVGTGFAIEPAAPVDWFAEAKTSADALERDDRIERERRSLDGPKQHPPSPRYVTPACVFEKCEPNWGSDSSIFKSQHSKGGRIEKIPRDAQRTLQGLQKIPDGEVVHWFNNWCYQILVSADRSRRGMIWCGVPLGKTTARGDLLDHMNESPPPEQRATDVP